MTSVLYLHGFASSPSSAKIVRLKPLLEPHGITLDTPDLNVPSFEHLDFDAMVGRALEHAARTTHAAIVGSSLGSLVALEVVRRGIELPLVLIAPALGIGDRWKTRLAEGDPVIVWNHALEANAPIHRAFFDRMNRVDVDVHPPSVRVTVIMGTNDETVPISLVDERWSEWEHAGLAPGSRFIRIDGGDHGLTDHAELISREILSAVSA